MICTKCGEENSDGFRFCGMCGALLEARRPAGAPRIASAPEGNVRNEAAEPRTSPAPNSTTVPPATGPSFLGLNQPFPDRPDVSHPSVDTLRDKSFSGLDSFFEPEEPKTGGRRVFILLVLLVALGAAGWWAFSNYNIMGSASGRNSQTAATKLGDTEAAPDNSASRPKSSSGTASSPDTGSSQPAPPATIAPTQAVTPNPASVVEGKAEVKAEGKTEPKAEPKTEQEARPSASDVARPAEPAHPQRAQKSARAAKSAPPLPVNEQPVSADRGDALFRRGEAYLYGRGVPENCDEAVKNLKAASAKQNAKARSAFGTMYATGHCAPRDLPTAYSWFALALRVDPNNQILEKDLTAVWNQMTPPERQMATKMKH
jgi:zinc-ribbon domain